MENDDDRAVSAIDELFTADEAQALKAYIESTHELETVIIKPADLPYPKNTMPISAIPLGGPQDVLMIRWLSAAL